MLRLLQRTVLEHVLGKCDYLVTFLEPPAQKGIHHNQAGCLQLLFQECADLRMGFVDPAHPVVDVRAVDACASVFRLIPQDLLNVIQRGFEMSL